MKLILTGTTGNLGSRVLNSIISQNLIPPSDLIISTSSAPDKLSSVVKEHAIRVIRCNFADPDKSALQTTLRSSDADALFLVSYPSPSVDRWLYHKSVIDAAKASGTIKLVIYTSLMFGGEHGTESIAGVQQAHIKTVEYMKQVSIDHVVIREGLYAESWWLYAGFQPYPIPSSTEPLEFVIPNDGPVSWVTWDDLGEGTARILSNIHTSFNTSPRVLHRYSTANTPNPTLCLTGSPRSVLTISAIAPLVEKYSGRKVTVSIVGRDAARKHHLTRRDELNQRGDLEGGAEDWVIESWSGWHDALQQGECAFVDPLLEELLGREPRGIEEYAEKLFTAKS